jgi:hypothetical protein
MQTPSTHPSPSGPKLAGLLATLLLFLVTGCADTAPRKFETPPPPQQSTSHLFQLTDHDWLDLSDIWALQFQLNDLSNNPGGDAFTINVWRNASETPITFGFADEASAYASYRRLVSRLGGTLKEDHWTRPVATARPAAATVPPTVPPPPPPATQQSQSVPASPPLDLSDPYVALKQGMTDLARCRDERLMTEAEYQRVRDATVDAFSTRVAEGGRGYDTGFAQLYSELAQLELMKKDHLLTDEQIAAMRQRIAIRYGLTAPSNP